MPEHEATKPTERAIELNRQAEARRMYDVMRASMTPECIEAIGLELARLAQKQDQRSIFSNSPPKCPQCGSDSVHGFPCVRTFDNRSRPEDAA